MRKMSSICAHQCEYCGLLYECHRKDCSRPFFVHTYMIVGSYCIRTLHKLRAFYDYISGCGGFGFIVSLWTIAIKNSTKAISNMNENTVSRVGDSTPPRYRSLVSIAMVRAANIPKAAEANSIPFIFSFL